MSADCERFELEIGLCEHGLLDAARSAALDAHLATCASCRSFASVARRAEAALRRQSESDAETIDWGRLSANTARIRRSYRIKLWLAPIFFLQVPLIALLAPVRLPREVLIAGPFATVAIFAAYVWLVGRPFRMLTAAARGRDDLLLGYVRELRRQRLRAWIFAIWNASVAVMSVECAFAFADIRGYAAACALFFAAWSAYDVAVTLPRRRRALTEVSR